MNLRVVFSNIFVYNRHQKGIFFIAGTCKTSTNTLNLRKRYLMILTLMYGQTGGNIFKNNIVTVLNKVVSHGHGGTLVHSTTGNKRVY